MGGGQSGLGGVSGFAAVTSDESGAFGGLSAGSGAAIGRPIILRLFHLILR